MTAWLEEKATEAGYRNARDFAKRMLGARKPIERWNRGRTRPQFATVVKIADAFGTTLAEAIQNLWGERLGAPCPCGCGGVTVAPETPGSWVLATERQCPGGCGNVVRFDGLRKAPSQHTSLCKSCSHRGARVILTCPKCPPDRNARAVAPYRLRQAQRVGNYKDAIIDWDSLTGVALCVSDASRARIPDARRKVSQRGARFKANGKYVPGGTEAWKDHVRAALARRTPEQIADSLALARAANRGSHRTAEQRAKMSRARTGINRRTPIGTCGLCPFYTDRAAKWHGKCLQDWMATRRTMGVWDVPQKGGRPPDPATVLRWYGVTVSHLLRGAQLKSFVAADARRDPHLLANEEKKLRTGIKRFISKLPSDGRAGARFQRLRQNLVYAAAQNGFALDS